MALLRKEEIISKARSFIGVVDSEYPIDFAYLFGSQARAAGTLLSDVDIALYFKKDYPKEEEVLIRGYLIELGRKYFSKSVDLISLRTAALFLKYTVIRDGVLIKDSVNQSRAEFESLALREYFDFQHYSDFYNNAVIVSIKEKTYFGDEHGR